MTAPGDETAAEGRGRGELRASHADREKVIGTLKTAYVQGRLTEDELGARVDRVCTSRTYAELAEVIADIPAALTAAGPPRAPWRATKMAWRFEYAVFLPGIVAVILLPGGPETTLRTLVTLAAVVYLVFWILGLFVMVSSRRVQPVSEQQLPPVCSVDREQVVQTLGAALAQGRLTEDEHDIRAAQASAARSRAELAALTADLPADLTARLPTARDAWAGACVSVGAAGVLAALLLWHPDDFLAFVTALSAAATVLLAPPITVGLIVDARYQKKRSSRQLSSAPFPHGSL